MHPWPEKITAVGEDTKHPWGGTITAAMTHREYAPISRIMASTGLEEKLTAGGKPLSVAEVDKALADRPALTSIQKMTVKGALSRLGLLA